MYELIRSGQSSEFIKPCDGSENLMTLLADKTISNLECKVSDLTIFDLNTPSIATDKQPIHILGMSDYGMNCDSQLLMQVATEPNLSENFFTQAQIAELIKNNFWQMVNSCADEIFAMFTIEKDGITRELLACIHCFGQTSSCYIFDLKDEKEIWTKSQILRSVVIKTN